MPHFIIECSDNVVKENNTQVIMREVYDTANSTGLFTPGDIKVRINSYHEYYLAEGKDNFIHVFGNIMQGRTDDQKNNLSKKIVSKLKQLFPDVSIISMNIRDFEKASYWNKEMV